MRRIWLTKLTYERIIIMTHGCRVYNFLLGVAEVLILA